MGRPVYRSKIRVSEHEDGTKLCLLQWSEVDKTEIQWLAGSSSRLQAKTSLYLTANEQSSFCEASRGIMSLLLPE